MRIKAFTTKGKTCRISVISDNILLASILILPLLTSSPNLVAKLVYALLVLLVAGSFVLALSAVLQRVRQWRIGARPITQHEGQEIISQVGEMGGRVGLRKVSVYWVPSNFTIGARVFGVFKKRIVVTGGLAVLAKRSPTKCASILAHELAHLRNGDTILYLLIALLSTSYFTNLLTGGFLMVPSAAFGIIFFVLFVVYFLRRRELIADSLAMNAVHDRSVYLSILLSPTVSHGTRVFHPKPAARCRALLYSSPVLRTSIWILLIVASFQLNFLLNSDPINSEPTNFLLALPLSLLAIFAELWKDPRRKIAAGFAEDARPLAKGNWRAACATELDRYATSLEYSGDQVGATVLRRSGAELLLRGSWRGIQRIREIILRNLRPMIACFLIFFIVAAFGYLVSLISRGPRPIRTIKLNDSVDSLAVFRDSSLMFLLDGRPSRELPDSLELTRIVSERRISDLVVSSNSTLISIFDGSQTDVMDALSQIRDERLSAKQSGANGVFSPTGRFYAKVDRESTFSVIRVDSHEEVFNRKLAAPILRLAFSFDEKHIAAGLTTDNVEFFGMDGMEDRPPLQLDGSIRNISLDDHATLLLSYPRGKAQYGEVWILGADGKNWERKIPGGAKDDVLSPNGQLLATEADDTIEVASGVTQKTVEIPLSGFFPYVMAFSPDDRFLAAITSHPTEGGPPEQYAFQVWSTDGSLLSCMWIDEPYGAEIAFSPDGRYVAVSSRYRPPGTDAFYGSGDATFLPETYSIRLYDSNDWVRWRPWTKSACNWPWNRFSLYWYRSRL
jgi:Zn-dependent protease with chaperone function/WD40 repeat protein